jgi:hypothetical protein
MARCRRGRIATKGNTKSVFQKGLSRANTSSSYTIPPAWCKKFFVPSKIVDNHLHSQGVQAIAMEALLPKNNILEKSPRKTAVTHDLQMLLWHNERSRRALEGLYHENL